MRTTNVWIALAVISASACGGGGGSTSPNNQPSGNTPPPAGGIAVMNNTFSPSTKIVTVNTAVRWAWNSCTGGGSDPYGGGGSEVCVAHGVNFEDGTSSPTQDQGTYTRTFTTPGTYNYHCAVHGTGMAGAVTVQ